MTPSPPSLTRLAGVSVRVPDPAASAAFLETALHFHRRAGDGGVEHLTVEGDYGFPPPARQLTLEPGALGLAELSFEADQPALEALERRLAERGVAAEELPAGDLGARGVAFPDPGGLRIACRLRAARLDEVLPPSPIRPRRLGHVNLKVPDAPAAARFYEEVLGLRLSEQVGERLFFFRVRSDHHNLGLRGGAERADVHHVAFEVPGWESYRVICDHLTGLGHTVEYGPGRHGPGHNLFVYLRDPSSGLRLELFGDMAHIDDDSHEPPRWESVDRARTVNVWGPGPPASFLE